MTIYGPASGIAIVAVRILNFRSIANVEVQLNDLTVLVGANNAGKTSFLDALFAAIGAGRRSLGSDDIRLASDESLAPKSREVFIDVMIRPVGANGLVVDSYPEGSFWTSLWGTAGIASDDALNDFTAIRTALKWNELRGEHVLERRFLKEWRSFNDWTLAVTQDRPIGAGQLEPLAVHYVDAQRDLNEDLHRPGSFWRRLTEDLGLSTEDVDAMETTLSGINAQIVDKSAILKHLTEHLEGLQNLVASESGGVSVAPVARKLRDLAKGIDVSFNTAPLEDLRLFFKSNGDTFVTQLDTSLLKTDDLRKLQDTVIDTRGDILFSRGVILFEGQTEEQALPIYASRFWKASTHELGLCFVRVNGTDYFPFIWLLKELRIPWYVFSDGEAGPVRELDKALNRAGEAASNACSNVVVIPNNNGFEEQLLTEGYLQQIETAIDQIEGSTAYLDEYIATLHGKPKKKNIIREYQRVDGRLRAAADYLSENKMRLAKPVARLISELQDPSRRIPLSIRTLFDIISDAHGLAQVSSKGVA